MALFNQTTTHKLKALIAGSESGYSHGACQVLEQLNIDYIHVPNAQTALNEVNASAGSFFCYPDRSSTFGHERHIAAGTSQRPAPCCAGISCVRPFLMPI